MAEQITIDQSQSKEHKYQSLIPQIAALVKGESDQVANLANVTAALKETFKFFWVGFYLVKDQELVLGPFQGPVACTRISKGKGVCGACWEQAEAIIVGDVTKFPGHIACNPASRSEIVIPVIREGDVIMVLDVDSEQSDFFDESDREYLTQIAALV